MSLRSSLGTAKAAVIEVVKASLNAAVIAAVIESGVTGESLGQFTGDTGV